MIAGITASIVAAAGGPTDSGWLVCGTCITNGGGDQAWTNATNATAKDGSEATNLNLGTGDETDDLLATNFGFALPGGATITGVQLRHRTRANNSNDMDFKASRLRYSGANLGTNYATGHGLTATITEYILPVGSSETYMWGNISITVAQANSSTFGFIINFDDGGSGSGDDVWVDSLEAKIFYTT